MKTIYLTVIFWIITFTVNAQCAMCRATLENNFSNDQIGAGANINLGILYLFVFPYLLIGTVAYLWYRNTKKSRATG